MRRPGYKSIELFFENRKRFTSTKTFSLNHSRAVIQESSWCCIRGQDHSQSKLHYEVQKRKKKRKEDFGMSTKILLGRTFLFLSYLMFGAWLFCYVERTPATYNETSAKMLNELHQKYNIAMNHSEFMAFANAAHEAVKVGKKVDWTFLNATFYVFSALTTIGYGTITPETTLGQLLTVLYCLIGLPITMLALKTIGDAIVSGVRSFIVRIEMRLFKKRRLHRVKTKTFIATCLLMITFLLIGAIIEIEGEQWTLSEGIYAWFVTFSTIGFGDYVPLTQINHKHDVGPTAVFIFFSVICFVLTGFCVLCAVLTSLVAAAEELKKKTITDIWKRKRKKNFRAAPYNVELDKEYKKQGDDFVLHVKYRQRSGTF